MASAGALRAALRGLLIGLFATGSLRAPAQYLRHLNARSFLGAADVYHVVRDRAGFLWFCTDRGLVRYDGTATERYGRAAGLPDDRVFSLYEDRQGRIWPFCQNGRYARIERDGTVRTEANDTGLARLPHDDSYLTGMAEGRDSGLYFVFLSGRILHARGGHAVWDAGRLPDGGGTVVTRQVIRRVPWQTASLYRFGPGTAYCSAVDRKGLKVYRNDTLLWQLADPTLTNMAVTDLCLTRRGELLVCTIHGLEIIRLATGRRTRLLAGSRVSGCTADPAGNFWITTINDGVYFLHQEFDGLHEFGALSGRECIAVNDGRQVFQRAGALEEIVSRAGTVAAVPARRGVPSVYNPLLLTDRLAGFFDTWDKSSLILLRRAPDTLLRLDRFFKAMYARDDRFVFAYGKSTTYCFRIAGGRAVLRDSITYPQPITATCQDPQTGCVYFASGGRLYVRAPEADRSVPFFSAPQLAGATGLAVSGPRLLVATGGPQYYSLVPARPAGTFMRHGAGVAVRGFLPIGGRLILLADGADYLAGPGGAPQPIQYPFASSQYEHLAVVGGQCVVQLDGRAYAFDTALLNRRQPPVRVYLKRLVVNGRPQPAADVDVRNASRVDVQLALGVLDFSGGGRGVRYRLAGAGPGDWHQTAATEIALVLQKAGDYRIELLPDAHPAGTVPLRIHIRVHTPFFRSGPFFLLCGVAALVLCGAVALGLIRRRRRQFTRELDYLKLEHRAVNALLNPHFIFNAINNIQGLIHTSKGADAAEYLAVLSRLIRQNLENLQGTLIPLDDEIALIRRYVALQNLRFGGAIALAIHGATAEALQVQVPPLLLHTFVENAIVHGYRPGSGAFAIDIDIAPQGADYLRIAVRDTGIGLRAAAGAPAAHQKTSLGVSFNQKRLRRLSQLYGLHQSITVSDRADRGEPGTEVVICLYARLRTLFGPGRLTSS